MLFIINILCVYFCNTKGHPDTDPTLDDDNQSDTDEEYEIIEEYEEVEEDESDEPLNSSRSTPKEIKTTEGRKCDCYVVCICLQINLIGFGKHLNKSYIVLIPDV